jgi:transcription factor SFP1
MELDVDHASPSSGGPTPPDTPLATPLSSHPAHSFNHFGQPAQDGSPRSPVSAFDTTTVLPTRSIHGHFPSSRNSVPDLSKNPEPFNGYAGYSDYSSSMPGTVPSPPATDDMQGPLSPASEPHSPYGCLPPAVVFSTANTPANTPATSRVPSPSTTARPTQSSSESTKASSSQQCSPRASTTLSRPASSLLLSKPFRCPKPNCNKSYKQANGLKYHMTHGSCNFAPPKDLEQVQALLASKRSAREALGEDDNLITEGELREVEREAERRLRPFACGVGDCQRRYKNMNGLRYHYQHSGDHGTVGLALLASGQHECLQHAHGKTSAASSRQSTPLASGQSTPVTGHSTPTYAQQYQQQMLYTSAQQQYLRAQQQQAMQMHVQMTSYPVDANSALC